ncbi:MAG: deoxyribonuclease IV [Nitrososphaerales archaeon]|jgi:deoxyribonuclease-4
MLGELLIGFHISIEKSLDLAFDRAQEIGCTTFQIFTRNPRTWRFKPLEEDQIEAFRDKRKKSGFKILVAHMPYLPNLASPDKATMKASRLSLSEEVRRCDDLGIDYLVTHLGSHLGGGTMLGVKNVSDAVNQALATSNGSTIVLLENMAGQKNSVGSRFEELRLILDRIRNDKRAGVCLDTCHAFASGFDLSGPEAVSQSMAIFKDSVGYDCIKVVHLNDSKGALGSSLDRHESLGKGKIGRKGMKAFLHCKGINERPLIMETPYTDLRVMRQCISLVRSLVD